MSNYVGGIKVDVGVLGSRIEVAELETLAKGDLIVGDGSGAPSTHPVGANNTILRADSARTHGVAWTAGLFEDASGNVSVTTQLTVDNLRLNGNTLSSLTGDIDVTSASGGVFKFSDNAFRAGLDASNYLEVGHGGSNSFLNQVGAGGMDFRFGGVTKATFTSFGHLHLLTDVDQKHTLKIVTANNLNDTGISWENSGGSFTHSIFRTDAGSNRADLIFAVGLNVDVDLLTNSFKIHGSAANEGRLEVLGEFQISSGNPGASKVLTSDANGIATWVLASGGGFTDAGTTVILTNINDDVGIGTSSPNAKLEVGGNAGVSVGGFPSGQLHVTSPSSTEFQNAVITGHNSFGGNTQLWYLGSISGSNNSVAFINRQTGSLSLLTSGNGDILLTPNGTGGVGIGVTPTEKLHANGQRDCECRHDHVGDVGVFDREFDI